MAINNKGFPHIIYYNANGHDLAYYYEYDTEIRTIELATIIEADVFPVVIGAGVPPQVLIAVDGELPDSCSRFNEITSKRYGNTVEVTVTIRILKGDNCFPTDDIFEKNLNLGGNFNRGERYFVIINGVEYIYDAPVSW